MKPLNLLNPFLGDDLAVVIETPKGSQNKFAYDSQLGGLMLKGVLPAGAVFPFDFGFVPSTLGDDGDPLDVLVLMDAPAFAGCVVACRLLGVIEAVQGDHEDLRKNDRLLAVAAKSLTHRSLQDIADLSADLVGQIEHFFVSYNQIKGKVFRVKGRAGRDRARALVDEGIVRLKQQGSENPPG